MRIINNKFVDSYYIRSFESVNIMKVSAKLTNLRIAPRKVRLVSNLIKGLDVAPALNQLDIHVKRSNPYFEKLLLSAVSNGENNFGLDKNNLYIFDIIVD